MKLVKSLLEIPEKELAASLGNFDGVHAGHRFLLKQLYLQAKKSSLPTLVITFTPHPHYILRGEDNFYLINTYEERRKLLAECEVDYLWEISFNRDISLLSAKEFFEQFILGTSHNGPKIKLLSLGYDFSFGHKKMQGKDGVEFDYTNYTKTLEIRKNNYLELELKEGQELVSSGKIREYLRSGRVDLANRCLERAFFLQGRVLRCNGRGRMIGFPTANISLETHQITPQEGVYASYTRVHGLLYASVTNVGYAPSFEGAKKLQVETHIFDFNLDIYGLEIRVHFLQKIRNEQKFESIPALTEQIYLDKTKAREIHGEYEQMPPYRILTF